MKISARNVFKGEIRAIKPGAVNDEVTLSLAGGDELVAVITHSSVVSLGLTVGNPATAIIKAPWVIVATDDGGLRFSARNLLRGTVSALNLGPVNADVSIALPGGNAVHAVITAEAARDLALAVGQPATAIIKASHVVLAV